MGRLGATSKEAKKAETDANLARVKAALAEAHEAAAAAFAEFMESAGLTPDGLVVDKHGYASVVVYKPSYKLRTALKALGEVERDYNGAWHISDFNKHVTVQSITAHEKACRAARDVLERRFPGEGDFFSPSRSD